jgi:hypothetical protein
MVPMRSGRQLLKHSWIIAACAAKSGRATDSRFPTAAQGASPGSSSERIDTSRGIDNPALAFPRDQIYSTQISADPCGNILDRRGMARLKVLIGLQDRAGMNRDVQIAMGLKKPVET